MGVEVGVGVLKLNGFKPTPANYDSRYASVNDGIDLHITDASTRCGDA